MAYGRNWEIPTKSISGTEYLKANKAPGLFDPNIKQIKTFAKFLLLLYSLKSGKSQTYAESQKFNHVQQ